MPKAQAIPRPYVIEPPVSARRIYSPGEPLPVGLVLIGRALDYLSYFLEAFQRMGEQGIGQGRGRFAIVNVRVSDTVDGSATSPPGREEQPAAPGVSATPSLTTSAVTVRLLTPTRIEKEGKPEHRLDFPLFFGSLLRRLRNLQFFHDGGIEDADDQRLRDFSRAVETEADRGVWVDQARRSHGRWTPQGGLLGDLSFKGDLTPFMPFLRLGELVHVGKGATFGMGRYQIVGEKGDVDIRKTASASGPAA